MKRTFTRFVLLVLIGLGYAVTDSNAQDLSPWTDNPYGNEWIDYSKKYVRVGVPADGIYKVPFGALSTSLKKTPAESITPAQIQLWHRGKEVAIISADNDWVVFYGEKNDGASDGLMFRPGPEARLNPYVSLYSEEGSYFFTIAVNPKRASVVNAKPDAANSAAYEPYHFQTDIKKYDGYQYVAAQGRETRNNNGQQFGFSTFAETNALNQSYMGIESGWVGPNIFGAKTSVFNSASQTWTSLTPKSLDVPVNLKNWVYNSADKPVIEILVNGLNDGTHNINLYMSTSTSDIDTKNIMTFPAFSGFGGRKNAITLNDPAVNISNAGVSYLRIKSLTNVSSPNAHYDDRDLFSLGYYSITYPQLTDMGTGSNAVKSSFFNFKPTNDETTKVSIRNALATTNVYDVSDPYQPVKLNDGSFEGTNLNLQTSRYTGRKLKLCVVNSVDEQGILPVAVSNILPVTLNEYHSNTNFLPTHVNGAINPSAFDYLIISNDNLQESAKLFADYRATAGGGSYKSLIINIRSIYDQFNYGEPSPIAIRRFVDYMIKDGIRPRHNLLLVGHSVSYPIRVSKEMPGEIPTYGDPGSDVLLAAGLSNGSSNHDVPSIPVGRINAFTTAELSDYFGKVQQYENQTATQTSSELGWRKNVVHLIGAKYLYELSEINIGGFKKIFKDVSPYVTALDPSRHIDVISNDQWATSNSVEATRKPAPISPLVNNGVGMIAYYGHGNQTGTLYDIQTVKLPEFTNNGKYPFIYFNGCGVGNIFSTRLAQQLSTEWLLTPNKGAIAIFGNAYKSYVSPTTIYIDRLYQQLFLKTDLERRTVGQVLVDLANIMLNGGTNGRILADDYQVANIHQTNLYGDPALKILNTIPVPPSSLPVSLVSFNARVQDEDKVQLNWKTAWEKNNSHYIVERSYNGSDFKSIGYMEGKGNFEGESEYQFVDGSPNPGVNYYRLMQVDRTNGSNQSGDVTYSRIISAKITSVEALSLYPNPVQDKFLIKLNIPSKVKKWSLYDSGGRLLQSGNGTEVRIKNLVSGTYIVEVLTEDGTAYKKNILKI